MSESVNKNGHAQQAAPLIKIDGLKVHFPIYGGLFRRKQDVVKAVDGVSFSIPAGKTTGLVGESGSGKTTIGRSIIKLAPITEGSIEYKNQLISDLDEKSFFPWRKSIQMIFQDPFNSLNPRMTCEAIIGEPLDIHFPKMDIREKRNKVHTLLDKVELPPQSATRYPHEFSGGQRQRIGIARALAVEPEIILCDEPVSALDVSVQAQIINLLQDLQEELGLTYLFIAHDLAVVEHISDEILVMTEGKLVEQGEAASLVKEPQHPYTQKLLDAVTTL